MIGSSTCIMQGGILGPIKRESRVRQRGSNIRRQGGKRKAQKGDFWRLGHTSTSEIATEADRGVHTVGGNVVKSRFQGLYLISLSTMFIIVLAQSSLMSG